MGVVNKELTDKPWNAENEKEVYRHHFHPSYWEENTTRVKECDQRGDDYLYLIRTSVTHSIKGGCRPILTIQFMPANGNEKNNLATVLATIGNKKSRKYNIIFKKYAIFL